MDKKLTQEELKEIREEVNEPCQNSVYQDFMNRILSHIEQQAQEIERFRKGELWGKFDYYRAKAQHLEEALKENKKFLEWILEEYATSDKSVSDFVDEAEIYFDVTNEALKGVRGNEGRD
jgi:flagellar biosynthesis chaperone FliJ